MQKGRVVAALIGALVLVGCSGDDDASSMTVLTFSPETTVVSNGSSTVGVAEPATPPDGATTAPTDTETAAPSPGSAVPTTLSNRPWPPSQELLDASVLTIGDMPSGWARVTDDSEDDPPCGIRMSTILGLPDDGLPSGEAAFAEDENVGPYVNIATSVIPPDAANIDLLNSFLAQIVTCEDESDGTRITFSELSYPTVGDQSVAYRMHAVTSTGVSFDSDIVLARVGAVFLQVAGIDVFGSSTAILDQFVHPAIDRAVSVLG